jgi:hypothetical protein
LPRGKERTKKSDFGKPKSQVCLFAVANIALRAGANIARPDVPSGTSLSVPLFKNKDEKDIYSFCVSLATKPPRSADRESKSSCFPSCLKFYLFRGASQIAKVFAFCGVRVAFVFAFFFKMRTQNLNIYPFAKK